MIHRDDIPDTPDWHGEPRPCPVMWLDDHRPEPLIPPNVILGAN